MINIIKDISEVKRESVYAILCNDPRIAYPFRVFGFETELLSLFVGDKAYNVLEFPSVNSYKRHVEARYPLVDSFKAKVDTLSIL
jgi:hypothetical protein